MKSTEFTAAVKWLVGALIGGITVTLAMWLIPSWFLRYCLQLIIPLLLREHYVVRLATVPIGLAGGLLVFWRYEMQKQRVRRVNG